MKNDSNKVGENAKLEVRAGLLLEGPLPSPQEQSAVVTVYLLLSHTQQGGMRIICNDKQKNKSGKI